MSSEFECQEPANNNIVNEDQPPKNCEGDKSSLKNIGGELDLGLFDNTFGKQTGYGVAANTDPMQKGAIRNDINQPNRNYIYRYAKSIRGTDEAIKDLFSDIIIESPSGKPFRVPIVMAPQEKAVAIILNENVRKDNSTVVDRIKLPIMSIYQTGMTANMSRYTYHKAIDYMRDLRPDRKPGFAIKEKYERDTIFGVTRGLPVDVSYSLVAWTMYLEDMNQIIEQILPKILPMGYIRVRGLNWEIPVTLDGIGNNNEIEPGDQNIRVIKFQFDMTAQTYIAQPITRNKAVLKIRQDVFNSLEQNEINEAFDRLETAVEELE